MTRLLPAAAAVLTLISMGSASAPAQASPTSASPRQSDVLIAWNERVLTLAEAEDKLLTLKGVRTASMMHIAVHDVLNAIDARYAAYAFDPDPSKDRSGIDPVVAAAYAAYTVVLDQYPDSRAGLDEELHRWLGQSTAAAQREARELARASAAAILSRRHGDGWNNEAEYQWQPMGPGVYAEFSDHSGTPQGFIFGAGWATAKPFAMSHPGQFRSPPPPDIDSDAYTEAYEEVRAVGRYRSRSRTADQTHLAMWWKDFAERSHNRLARQLMSDESLDLWRAARLFALLNMSICDAYISSFENKFVYNHWRPYTAIRWAEHDGNPQTRAEPEWNNLHRHTYAFPSYPSAHGTACAAAATVLEDTFGDGYAFTMTTERVDEAGPMSGKIAMNPPTRRFASFSDAAMECALSRVYLGIHFRYDSIQGNRLGTQIGRHVLASVLTPHR